MSVYCIQKEIDSMIDRKLKSVLLNKYRDRVTFSFQEGPSQSFGVAGGCCSTSWIEHFEMPNDVDGAFIIKVEDGNIIQDHEEHDPEGEWNVIKVYNTIFHTNRGSIVLEFRNSSNGYYGGYLVSG